jgi:anaerobic magnesium-protoporphyrin IX monomethyl ester cyclase
MKILLIKPPMPLLDDFNGMAKISFPIGLGYVSSMLKKNGHDSRIIDISLENWKKINDRGDGIKYVGLSQNDITKLIKKEDPDVVGVSILTLEAVNALQIIDTIKKAKKNVLIIAGGPHLSVRPEQVISNPNVDILVIGEGEYTIVELMKEYEKNIPDFSHIAGIWFRKDGKIIKTPPREPIQDLNDLPFPDRSTMNKYVKAASYFQTTRDFSGNSANMITSRGCPFNCVFCSVRLSMGRQYRPRSPENVVNEIAILINKHNINYLYFEDDNLTFDKERMGKICDLIIEKGLNKNLSWSTPNGVRADRLDRELLIKMKKSGCKKICIAPESGCQEVVTNIIRKAIKLEVIIDIAKICKEVGILCESFFVIGFPGETLEQMDETVQFANMLKKKYNVILRCGIALPYYGTDMYKICKENEYLTVPDGKELELAFLNSWATIKTEDFRPEQLYDIKAKIQQGGEINRILFLIKNKPLQALRFFPTRYKFILKYILKRFVQKKGYGKNI